MAKPLWQQLLDGTYDPFRSVSSGQTYVNPETGEREWEWQRQQRIEQEERERAQREQQEEEERRRSEQEQLDAAEYDWERALYQDDVEEARKRREMLAAERDAIRAAEDIPFQWQREQELEHLREARDARQAAERQERESEAEARARQEEEEEALYRSRLAGARGADQDLLREMDARRRKEGTRELVGLPEHTGEGPPGALETVMRAIDRPRAEIFEAGRQVADIVTGKRSPFSMTEEQAETQRQRVEERQGFGDLAMLKWSDDDATWQRVLKVVPSALGDIASDPITWLTAGTAAVGRKTVAEAARATMAKPATQVARSMSDDAARGLVQRVQPDIMRDTLATVTRHSVDDLARMSADDLARLAQTHGVHRALAAEGLISGSQEAFIYGASRGLNQFLRQSAGLTDDAAKQLWRAAPAEMRGGLRFRVPFARTTVDQGVDLGVKLPVSVRITPGGGQASRFIPGMDKALDAAGHARNYVRTSGVGQAAARKFGGAAGEAYGNMLTRAAVAGKQAAKGGPDEVGQAYSNYDWLVRTMREAATDHHQLLNERMGVAIAGSKHLIDSADDPVAARNAMAEAFNTRGNWDEAFLNSLPEGSAKRAGYESAKVKFEALDTLWREADEVGLDVGYINDYLKRHMTDTEKARRAIAKGSRKGRASKATKSRTGAWAEWDYEAPDLHEVLKAREAGLPTPQGKAVISRWLSPTEVGAVEGRAVFETDPDTALKATIVGMTNAIKEARVVQRLDQIGLLPSAKPTAAGALDRRGKIPEVGALARDQITETERGLAAALKAAREGDTKPLRDVMSGTGFRRPKGWKARRDGGVSLDDLARAERKALPDEVAGEYARGDMTVQVNAGPTSGRGWVAVRSSDDRQVLASADLLYTNRGLQVPTMFSEDPRAGAALRAQLNATADQLGVDLYADNVVNKRLASLLERHGWEKVGLTDEGVTFRRPRNGDWVVEDPSGKVVDRAATKSGANQMARAHALREQITKDVDTLEALFHPARIPADPEEAHLFLEDAVQVVGKWLHEAPEKTWNRLKTNERVRTEYGKFLAGRDDLRELTGLNVKPQLAAKLEELGAFGSDEMAHMLERAFRAYADPNDLANFTRDIYQPWFTWWKTMATVGGGPRFFLRNMQSGVFQAYLWDVSPRHFALGSRFLHERQKLKRAVRKELNFGKGDDNPLLESQVNARLRDHMHAKLDNKRLAAAGVKLTPERVDSLVDAWEAFERQGMRQRTYVQQLRDSGRRTQVGEDTATIRELEGVSLRRAGVRPDVPQEERGIIVRGYDKSIDNPLIGTLADATEGSETWMRFSTYLKGAEQFGLEDGGYAATLPVKVTQFDYSDLSEFEARVAKNLLPFYNWTRRNLPLQGRAVLERPGKVSRIMHTNDAIREQFGARNEHGDNAVLPRWVRESFGWEIDAETSGEYPWAANLGWWPTVELNQTFLAGSGGIMGLPVREEEVMGQLNPLITGAYELASGVRTFTRNEFQPIESAPAWARIPGMRQLFDYDRSPDGEETTDPRRTQFARTLAPPLSVFDRAAEPAWRQLFGAEREDDRYVDRFGTSVASMLAGLPVSTLDARQQTAELRTQQSRIDRAMRQQFKSRLDEAREMIRLLEQRGASPEEIQQALMSEGLLR